MKKKVDIYLAPGAQLPTCQTLQAAGCDLHANLPGELRQDGIALDPMERKLIPTGVYIALTPGNLADIRPRSGLAFKHGVTVLNTPGTIDSDYRGEIKVLLINLGQERFVVKHKERIAQLVVLKHEIVYWGEVASETELGKTDRGTGGFGSTDERLVAIANIGAVEQGYGEMDPEVIKSLTEPNPIKVGPGIYPPLIEEYSADDIGETAIEVVSVENTQEVEQGYGDTVLSDNDIIRAKAERGLNFEPESSTDFEDIGDVAAKHPEAFTNDPETGEPIQIADVNGDGKVDETDLSIVHKAYNAEKPKKRGKK